MNCENQEQTECTGWKLMTQNCKVNEVISGIINYCLYDYISVRSIEFMDSDLLNGLLFTAIVIQDK